MQLELGFSYKMDQQQKQKMSHIRNRHNMTSASLMVQRKKPYLNNKTSHLLSKRPPNLMANSLADMQTASHRPKTSQDNVYNRNLHSFREIFNQNDTSQLPFMSSLRAHPKDNQPPKPTISEAFEVALKSTCNQTVRKRTSDFGPHKGRLAVSSYRWHNQTGRGSLWATNFQCSLRYSKDNPEQKRYYNYVKPIVYQNYQKNTYDKEEMICDRHYRSFSLK